MSTERGVTVYRWGGKGTDLQDGGAELRVASIVIYHPPQDLGMYQDPVEEQRGGHSVWRQQSGREIDIDF